MTSNSFRILATLLTVYSEADDINLRGSGESGDFGSIPC